MRTRRPIRTALSSPRQMAFRISETEQSRMGASRFALKCSSTGVPSSETFCCFVPWKHGLRTRYLVGALGGAGKSLRELRETAKGRRSSED